MNNEIQVRVNAELNRAKYAYDRYKIKATFALIYHEKELSIEDMGRFVRTTDRFIPLDSNYCFIIYHYTEQDNAYKASQNLLLKLDNHFIDTSSCIAMDSFDKDDSSHKVLARLQQIIKETKKSSFARIEYEDILDVII